MVAKRKKVEEPDESIPRYKVLEKCYHNEVLWDPEAQPIDPATGDRKDIIIDYTGIPGPHLEPVNEAAEAMCERYHDRMHVYDPILTLTSLTPPEAKEV